MQINTYKELIVWQRAIELVEEVYKVTSRFPKTELYNLVSQMRRAAISIPANIAEGYGRKSVKEYHQFYSIAYGSALELETHLIIAKRLVFITPNDTKKLEGLIDETSKMLHSIILKLKSKR